MFASLVSGICHINDPKKLGRIGARAFAFFIISTLIAIGLGALFAYWLRPGQGLNLVGSHHANQVEVSLLEFILGIVPSNPVASFAQGNILQILFFASCFAVAIILSGEKGKTVLQFVESLSEVMQSLTKLVMKLAPYGVFALMASAVASIGLKVILPLLGILLCNYIACLIQIFGVFCLTLRYLAKVNIVEFFRAMKDAIIVAFTTCSSAAALPVSLDCIRKHLGISKDIAGFVMSLGSTVNMNGAAIGQAVAAIFIAQAYNIEITWFKVIILFVTALIAAIGAAGIPGSGLIMLSVVLNALGLPLEGIALVAGVDRLREMLSTVTNILGDTVATIYVAKKEKQIEEKQSHALT
jgi:Na+/H+-dicarboxylate symporter